MTDEQFARLGPLAREIVETDRLIEIERSADAIDGFFLRDLKVRRADLKRRADALWGGPPSKGMARP
jgi:hypothetical protein